MAQMTRGQLKSIVKECLLEILTEGLAGGEREAAPVERMTEARPSAPRRPAAPPRSASPALNSVVFGSGQQPPKKSGGQTPRRAPDAARENAVRSHISALTSDPVMSQIFADTAASTLQEQIHADRGQGRPDLDSETAPDPLSDAFLSESAKNWSMLAFSDSKSR